MLRGLGAPDPDRLTRDATATRAGPRGPWPAGARRRAIAPTEHCMLEGWRESRNDVMMTVHALALECTDCVASVAHCEG